MVAWLWCCGLFQATAYIFSHDVCKLATAVCGAVVGVDCFQAAACIKFHVVLCANSQQLEHVCQGRVEHVS